MLYLVIDTITPLLASVSWGLVAWERYQEEKDNRLQSTISLCFFVLFVLKLTLL